MRIRLSLRREQVKLQPYTGVAFCGCRLLNGDAVIPCPRHQHKGDQLYDRTQDADGTEEATAART